MKLNELQFIEQSIVTLAIEDGDLLFYFCEPIKPFRYDIY